jgi:hypothetical protein
MRYHLDRDGHIIQSPQPAMTVEEAERHLVVMRSAIGSAPVGYRCDICQSDFARVIGCPDLRESKRQAIRHVRFEHGM